MMKRAYLGKLAAAAALAASLMGMGNIQAWASVLVPVAVETAAADQAADGVTDGAVEAETEPVKPEPTEYAHITKCAIQSGNQISIQGEMKGTWSDPAFYDNYLYLFELKPYQDSLEASMEIGKNAIIPSFLSNNGRPEERTFSLFPGHIYLLLQCSISPAAARCAPATADKS